MKHGLRQGFGIMAVAFLALGAGSAVAQTTANGPYYANPSWDQKLQCDTQATCPRFVVLANWNSEAVLDRETGLVWHRNPGGQNDWAFANILCHTLGANESVPLAPPGNRLGWRLPSVEELLSLVDRTQSNPALPAGHPFQGIQNTTYWTATTFENTFDVAYAVNFSLGLTTGQSKTNDIHFWCVRSGSSTSNPPY